jgi:hypothetical protein
MMTSFVLSPLVSFAGRGLYSRFMMMRGQTSSNPGCLPRRICWNTFRIASLVLISDQLARKYSTCTCKSIYCGGERQALGVTHLSHFLKRRRERRKDFVGNIGYCQTLDDVLFKYRSSTSVFHPICQIYSAHLKCSRSQFSKTELCSQSSQQRQRASAK